MSGAPQTDLIECLYNEVREEIQNRVSNSRYLAVMMDDTSDIGNVEQSVVSVRLVHDGEVEEHLLSLINSSSDMSATGFDKTSSGYIASEKLIGQSFGGAPTMSGEFCGVQRQIHEIFPTAYYNHCVAHRLALCASQSAKASPGIAKLFTIVANLLNFSRSSTKRRSNRGRNLPKPGDTRWLLTLYWSY